MRLLLLVLFIPIIGTAQIDKLYEIQWTLEPNSYHEYHNKNGDSLLFIIDDTTDFNPKATMEFKINGTILTSYVSFLYPTENGVITSKELPKPSISIYRDTIVDGDSTIIKEYRTENFIKVLQPPAYAYAGTYTVNDSGMNFQISFVGTQQEREVTGPFELKLEKNKLTLIKL